MSGHTLLFALRFILRVLAGHLRGAYHQTSQLGRQHESPHCFPGTGYIYRRGLELSYGPQHCAECVRLRAARAGREQRLLC